MNSSVRIPLAIGIAFALGAVSSARQFDAPTRESPSPVEFKSARAESLGITVHDSTWIVLVDAKWNADSWSDSWEKAGSAVGYREDGWLVTNAHVISGCNTVTVTGPDNVARSVDKWFADEKTDVAVLHVPEVEVFVPRRGKRNALAVADPIVIYGHPTGFNRTLTRGVVSGLHRPVFDDGKRNIQLMDFVQVDALLHKGNSGGGLFDEEGTLVGIVTATRSHVDGRHGLGFAIAIDDAQWIADKLIAEGVVRHGRLDVAVRNLVGLPLEVRNSYRINAESGLVFQKAYVEDGQTLLEPGDLLVEFDGELLENWTQFEMLIARHEPGTKHELAIERRGVDHTVTVTLGEWR